jgi:hypothetical protein
MTVCRGKTKIWYNFFVTLQIITSKMNKILLASIAILLLLGGMFLANQDATTLATPESNAPESTAVATPAPERQPNMTFFVTSRNPGSGANLGGLPGADAHCQTLATEAGAGDLTWQAYLSAAATEGNEAINARDRIGLGPWYNFNGELIASSVANLHDGENLIDKEKGLSETGATVNGRGDTPNVHDILTGSNSDGTLALAEGGGDTTCSNWTSESSEGSAVVGHHDRLGPETLETAASWNAAHGSRGCSLPDLNSTGGGGLLYCFAI